MSKTKIQWTDTVWNPVTGCDKVSGGCLNCYAKTVHDMRNKAYKEGKKLPEQYAVPFEQIVLHYDRLTKSFGKKPKKIFVNSMSDLFHKDVPSDFIGKIMQVIERNPQHIFQVLTKRPERMMDAFRDVTMPKNLWLGVTAENQKAADERIPLLLKTPAVVRWVSIEPMLVPVDLNNLKSNAGSYIQVLKPITKFGDSNRPALDWVVVGCESGKNRRPCKIEWIENIVAQCKSAGVAVFVKQLEINGKVTGDIEKFPEHLRIREFPNTTKTNER